MARTKFMVVRTYFFSLRPLIMIKYRTKSSSLLINIPAVQTVQYLKMFQVEKSDKKKWNPFVVLCGFFKWTGKDGTLEHGPHFIIHFQNGYGEFQEKNISEFNTTSKDFTCCQIKRTWTSSL